jgi:Ca2+-binding RTX toxin-like protein
MRLSLDGGAGDDLLVGGAANDTLIGGAGNDFVDGRRGDDVAFLGAGRDAFLWNPGEGNDRIEGGSGYDTMLFNGSGANETIDMSANGERFRFFRDVASVVMDTNDLEQVDFRAFGGADTITINDLTGTDIQQINLNLGVLGTAGGDGQIDTINVNGSAGNDVVRVANQEQTVTVTGLTATVTIARADANLDRLMVFGAAGDDRIDASELASNLIQLTIDGGAGDDMLIGSSSNDTLVGGDGNDTVIGGAGADNVSGSNGRDAFRFNAPNQGSDTISDFVAADDQILVRAADFGGGLVAGAAITVDQFILGTAAGDDSDRFIYNNTTGELFFDVDGSGANAQVLLATLTGAPTINNTNIVVI